MRTLGIIPSRFGSSRFPGKPLAQLAGKPLVAWVVEAVKKEGLSFHVWTVDDLRLALRAFAVGADTVTTNCAKEMLDEYNMLFEPREEDRDDTLIRPMDSASPMTLY